MRVEENMARQMIRSGEGGQALIEYVFILVLVAMVVLVVLLIFGPQLGNAFSTITHGI
jgi:Flp pilus assembly pilin Flp